MLLTLSFCLWKSEPLLSSHPKNHSALLVIWLVFDDAFFVLLVGVTDVSDLLHHTVMSISPWG